jgi:hypothetical protein
MDAVETATLGPKITKVAYKHELKKGEGEGDKAKYSRRQRARNPLKPSPLQLRQYLTEPRRQGKRHRNERTCSTCRFSSCMGISSLTRLASPVKKL